MKSIILDCGDDRAAIESAKQLVDGHDIELWQRDRMIAKLPRKLLPVKRTEQTAMTSNLAGATA